MEKFRKANSVPNTIGFQPVRLQDTKGGTCGDLRFDVMKKVTGWKPIPREQTTLDRLLACLPSGEKGWYVTGWNPAGQHTGVSGSF